MSLSSKSAVFCHIQDTMNCNAAACTFNSVKISWKTLEICVETRITIFQS